MKTTVKFKLRESSCMQGWGSLTLQVTRHRETRTMTTSCVLSFEEWNEKEQKVMYPENLSPKRKKELKTIEGKIKKDLKAIDKIIDELREADVDYTAQELIGRFRNCRQGQEQLFCAYVEGKSQGLKENKQFSTGLSR